MPTRAPAQPAPARTPPRPVPVLRRCACGGGAPAGGECEECRRKRLQRSPSASSSSVDTAPRAVHDVLRSPGQPLDGATRAYMEPRFGHSFANVRVHADARAAESASAVGARAYAVGHDVVFGRGMYSPASPGGRRLIAHELAHVVQQSGTASGTISRSLEVGPVDAPEERAADAAADAVMRGSSAEPGATSAARLARDTDDAGPDAGSTSTADAGPSADAGSSADAGRSADAGALADAGTALPLAPVDAGTAAAMDGGADAGVGTDAGAAPSADAGSSADAGAAPSTDAGSSAGAGADGGALAAGAAAAPAAGALREGGYTAKDGKGVIRIAWTFDDGPTAFTDRMKAAAGQPATWFIMSSQLGTGAARKAALAKLKTRQTAGDEVAVHSFHPSTGHVCFFPASDPGCSGAYKTMAAAMADLKTFTDELRGAGLRISFVRPPTGLHDEVTAYLAKSGVAKPDDEFAKILGAQDKPGTPAGLDAAAAPVKADFDLLVKTLAANNLHLWGGGAGSKEVTGNDWEAEASGVGTREETLMGEQAKLDPKTRIAKNKAHKFPDLLDQIAAGKRSSASLIVLAHDTTDADVKQVAADVADMEAKATAKKVKIVYMTESQLYTQVRGRAP